MQILLSKNPTEKHSAAAYPVDKLMDGRKKGNSYHILSLRESIYISV